MNDYDKLKAVFDEIGVKYDDWGTMLIPTTLTIPGEVVDFDFEFNTDWSFAKTRVSGS